MAEEYCYKLSAESDKGVALLGVASSDEADGVAEACDGYEGSDFASVVVVEYASAEGEFGSAGSSSAVTGEDVVLGDREVKDSKVYSCEEGHASVAAAAEADVCSGWAAAFGSKAEHVF